MGRAPSFIALLTAIPIHIIFLFAYVHFKKDVCTLTKMSAKVSRGYRLNALLPVLHVPLNFVSVIFISYVYVVRSMCVTSLLGVVHLHEKGRGWRMKRASGGN